MSSDDPTGEHRTSANEESTRSAAEELVHELRVQSQSEMEIFANLQMELRRIARNKMRHERQSHTLQPTALVNEAFLKMQSAHLPAEFWMDEDKVLRIVAHAMEQILNDWADAHSAKKRGGQHRRRVPLDENQAQEFAEGENVLRLDSGLLMRPEQSEEVLGVREALSTLRRAAPRQARIMQLQFYGGLTQNEVATALGLSVETIKIETRKAKAFLKVHLTKQRISASQKTA